MPRCKLTLEYDGTRYAGWQRQKNVPSIQQAVEEALSRYYNTAETFRLQCAGRTDAGVHARGQVAHVDLPEQRDAYSIQQGVNHHLGDHAISVLQAERVSDDFNARFGATQRHYLYHIINRNARLTLEANRAWQIPEALDVNTMHRAAQRLVGTHDFNSFRDSQCQAKSSVKSIDRIEIYREGEHIYAELSARSFLHHQVRIIMGSLRRIGNGKWSEADLIAALDAKHRTAAGETAPAHGLYFMAVDYPATPINERKPD